MPRKAANSPFGRRTFLGLGVLAAISATASIVAPPGDQQRQEQTLASPAAVTAVDLAINDWTTGSEATAIAAQLALVCPQAAAAWQKECEQPAVAVSYTPMAARQSASARITGVRLAQNPAVRLAQSPHGEWLVRPETWFVPEDQVAPPPSEPIESEVANPPRVESSPESPLVPAEPMESATETVDSAISQDSGISPPAPVQPAKPAVESSRPQPLLVGPPTESTEPATSPKTLEAVPPPVPATAGPFAPPPLPASADPPLGFDSVSGRLPSPHGSSPNLSDEAREAGELAHRELLAKNRYPSARDCAVCHQKIYDEWAISSHAYAFVSPMFQKFEQKIREVSRGTVGHFCYRCHAPVSTAMGVGQDEPLWNLAQVEREGVTCIACHRVRYRYTKSNGERRIEPGDIYDPVYGGIGGDGVAKVIADAASYKVKTSDDEKGPGQAIHREGRPFDQLGKSEFCTSCHQVAVHPGIKLEVVWEQYRQSPARKKGISCQDCHMGKVPGIASGYEVCAIAEINGKTVCDTRKHGNHTFYGPGYSIAHPGVFPFHKDAGRWTMDQWLKFDWRAGWGTDDFEDAVDNGQIVASFPKVWAEADDRYDAREIIDDNLKRLGRKTELRRQVMENGSHVDGPFFKAPPRRGTDLVLHYHVANTNEGHNLPTASLGAQPQLWANVVLIAPDGRRAWETGYTDHWGDLCDIHSQDVRKGIIPFDSQLFNLQTMFLITGATGTDREFYLPVNVDFDQLPFLRPGAIPTTVTNHPPFIRMESRSIAPLGVKRVRYKIPGEALAQPGRYRLSFRMRSRTEPIYFMRFCDATIEMQRAMNEGILDIHPYSVEFVVE
jgi:hypothetical protein